MRLFKLLQFLFLLLFVLSCQDVKVKTIKATVEEVNLNANKASYQAAPEALKTWINARAGTGKAVHWLADGGVFEEPHQMGWQRYGDLPRWYGGGKGIIQLYSWRVESHDEFPKQLMDWAKKSKPNWLTPPKDVAEVRALQKGEGGPG